MHPTNNENRNNVDENCLIKIYGIFCDIALIFLAKNNYVIHDQIFSEDPKYICISAKHLI